MSNDHGTVLRREAQAIGELAALHRDPVFFGRGVPRGDGRTVVVVPGLFGTDAYLQPLRAWLARIGYAPARSTLTINAGCPDRLRTQVERSLARRLDERPGPLCLIGHSRGGMLAWALATRLQARVSHLVLLGSPAPAVVAMMRRGPYTVSTVARSTVATAGASALRLLDPDCTVPDCGCPYTEDLRRPLAPATRVLSIFSRDDPIVPVAACRTTDGENVEIGGSHSGLAHNRAVYPHLARFLAAT